MGTLRSAFCRMFSYCCWPTNLPPGKNVAAVASVLQFVPHFFIRDPQTQPLGFGDQGLPADQVLGGALGKVGQQHGGLLAAAGKLLAQHLPGLALHFKRGDRLARHLGHYALPGPPRPMLSPMPPGTSVITMAAQITATCRRERFSWLGQGSAEIESFSCHSRV